MNYLRCRACGFIIKESKLGDKCPACGVSRNAFEQYEENISKRRKFILDLHLHPIVLHFPQAIGTLIPVFIIAGYAIPYSIGTDFMISARILSYLLPFTVIAAITSGLVDGMTRFKKVTTPILIKKISFASVLLIISIVIFLISVFYNFSGNIPFYILILSIAGLLCQFALGQLGKMILHAKLSG